MKEININIEGYNVNGICVGCLNYNRRMFYHPSVKECFRLLANIDVPDGLEVQVCWECLARVRSAITFKEQILKSYDFLIQYSREHTFLDSPSDFSPHATVNIDQTNVEVYECIPEDVVEEEKDLEVKEEEEIEDKYAFEVAVKEETFEDQYFQDIPAMDNDVTSDEDVQLSKLKEKETEKVKKKRKGETKRDRERDRMPANKRPRKTTRGIYDISQFEGAFDQIIQGVSLRKAAKMFGLTHVTLQKYKKKRLESNYPVTMGYARNSFFTKEQEEDLTMYIKKYADIYPGICVKLVRKYAKEFSEKLELKTPKPWLEHEMAGIDWYKNFMYRNKGLDDKIARISAKEKVAVFYDRLWTILGEYNFCDENIYCIDEIGVNFDDVTDKIRLITTENVVSLQVAQIKFAYAANARGDVIPPLFLMPKDSDENVETDVEIKKENDIEIKNETTFINFLKDGIDLKNLPDWTEDPSFLIFLKHFTKYLKNPVGPKLLLLLENQTFHLSIDCLDFCKDNDIILLVIPCYMSQNIQPLHFVVTELKKHISSMYQNLVTEKPERKRSVYVIPNLVSDNLVKCLNESCIQDSFKNTGIFPYNREVIIGGR